MTDKIETHFVVVYDHNTKKLSIDEGTTLVKFQTGIVHIQGRGWIQPEAESELDLECAEGQEKLQQLLDLDTSHLEGLRSGELEDYVNVLCKTDSNFVGHTNIEVGTRVCILTIQDKTEKGLEGHYGIITHPFGFLGEGGVAGIYLDDGELYNDNKVNLLSGDIVTIDEDKVEYKDEILKIKYLRYGKDGRNYGELFDFLGEHDIITASELGEDVILMNDEVFLFTKQNEKTLQQTGFVDLENINSLDEFIDTNNESHVKFLKWYRGEK